MSATAAGPAAPAGAPGGRGTHQRGGARSALLRAALLLLAACALATRGDAVSRAAAPPPPVRRLAHARAVRRPLNRTHSTLSKSSLIGYDPNAKCADGSPCVPPECVIAAPPAYANYARHPFCTRSAYIYSAMFKTPAMAATWVMYLPGTYFCWDAASCAKLQFWCASLCDRPVCGCGTLRDRALRLRRAAHPVAPCAAR